MAITIRERPAAPAPLAALLSIDPALLERPEAQAARQRGLLRAKAEALRSAEGLLAWGHLLTWAIIFVSAIHIWESVAAIAPAHVGALQLPAAVYHGAALAFTLMIDACALYIAKANAAAAFVGAPSNRWTIYFYLVTALLNASFVARHAPAIDVTVQAQLLPLLAGSFVLLLPLSIPAGIVAVETSNRTLEAVRLALLVEVETLRGVITGLLSDNMPQESASEQVMSPSTPPELATLNVATTEPAPMGGRPMTYGMADLLAAFPDGEGILFTPRDVRVRLRCSEGSAQRVIQAAMEAGQIERAARGAYRRTQI
ncbi:hypothetical protein EKD04_022330 [Chloroflexales bacterium ZM16-3]|nr:hypothetical protein [Chloroflexales bacterium ZM16-3]